MAGKKRPDFNWYLQDGCQKVTSLTPMVSFWMPFVNPVLSTIQNPHTSIFQIPHCTWNIWILYKLTSSIQMVWYSDYQVFKLDFGIVRIKWLPKVTGQDWTFKYQTKNVQFSNGLDKMVADHKNTVGVRILNKFVIWMVGVCSVFLWGPRIKSATTYRVSLPWSANSFGKFVLFQISLVFRLLKPV